MTDYAKSSEILQHPICPSELPHHIRIARELAIFRIDDLILRKARSVISHRTASDGPNHLHGKSVALSGNADKALELAVDAVHELEAAVSQATLTHCYEADGRHDTSTSTPVLSSFFTEAGQ